MSHDEQELLASTVRDARRSLASGDLPSALEAFESLHQTVRHRHSSIAERAFVNAASVRAALNPKSTPIRALRGLLSASRDLTTVFLAAHALTRYYHSCSQPRHALFYAHVATANAPQKEQATARHLLGVSRLALCEVAEAIRELSFACDHWIPTHAPIELATSTLAYAHALHGAAGPAIRLAESSNSHSPGSPLYECEIHLNLGFTFLELRHFDAAYFHARQSVATTRITPSHEHKLALYLAGESCCAAGNSREGLQYFHGLCDQYYPQHDIAELLSMVRTAPVVNWLT